jgi:hypothetical protein
MAFWRKTVEEKGVGRPAAVVTWPPLVRLAIKSALVSSFPVMRQQLGAAFTEAEIQKVELATRDFILVGLFIVIGEQLERTRIQVDRAYFEGIWKAAFSLACEDASIAKSIELARWNGFERMLSRYETMCGAGVAPEDIKQHGLPFWIQACFAENMVECPLVGHTPEQKDRYLRVARGARYIMGDYEEFFARELAPTKESSAQSALNGTLRWFGGGGSELQQRAAQVQAPPDYEAIRGITFFAVMVGPVTPEAAADGVDSTALANLVGTLIQQRGIPIVYDRFQIREPHTALIFIQISTVHTFDRLTAAIHVDFEVRQEIPLRDNPSFPCLAPIWRAQSWTSIAPSAQSAAQIEMLINRQVDEFIAAHRHATGAAESSG